MLHRRALRVNASELKIEVNSPLAAPEGNHAWLPTSTDPAKLAGGGISKPSLRNPSR